jgi:hypothetical protein
MLYTQITYEAHQSIYASLSVELLVQRTCYKPRYRCRLLASAVCAIDVYQQLEYSCSQCSVQCAMQLHTAPTFTKADKSIQQLK